ncbi:MAG: SDR family NAD(P)-dependent oxidoreductase [Cyanobacteria bacterium]|nr:SDR family NAD(P)-dependent oxidoreductase [Cyanobacteria bacterium CG_2015-16_32_12]NCO78199.1 SDR family NAD(P)-dependent oxidoreductase [Cyanobacteria bacterium CG_2015-22_32_23]NCQ03595.1 SDR family NAD(P)-dependent oxidoreductase [Cyanobacteria bacterium CG_2015-09_32_10]NCQ41925.1 SDR family NAD(P)-dependent oxidoreductase [Cyanobacteria bacterium CG_2015-04_32_10]NCS85844.1 SDR family NAD(P)-dependent oxidoreductase [Cyanobacteria bacterium CG_2015-02_32_10]
MVKNILIIGASQGIGNGFVQQLLTDTNVHHLFATYRKEETAKNLLSLESLYPHKLTTIKVNVTKENDIEQATQYIKTQVDNLHLVINCVGILHEDNLQPEKSLKHLNADNLLRYFQVNTIPSALWAKHLLPLLKHSQRSIFASISAKVGSIEDNHLGGWYGYRASKAALNMLLKNIAIEYSRVSKNTIVIALHPGTTDTQLSAPFQKNVPQEKLFSVSLCTQQLLSVIENLTIKDSGKFFSWDGSNLPW